MSRKINAHRIALKSTNAIADFINALVKIADEEKADKKTTVYFAIDEIYKTRPHPELLKNWDDEENTAQREELKAKAEELKAEEKPEEKDEENPDKNAEEETEENVEGNAHINLSVKDGEEVYIKIDGNVDDQLQLIALFLKETSENVDVPIPVLMLQLMDKVFGDIDEGENE